MKSRPCEELCCLPMKRTGLYLERKRPELDADESASSHHIPLLVVISHGWQIPANAPDFHCRPQHLRFHRNGNCICIQVALATYCRILLVPFTRIVDLYL